MTTLAYIGLNPTAHDILLSGGLILAAALLAVLASSRMRRAEHQARRIPVAALTLIAVAAIIWALTAPVSRLASHRRISHTTDTLLLFVLGLSDSELQTFGVRLESETWEGVPPDGYQRLLARAKSEGRLDGGGGSWSGDGRFLDLWGRPFRIGVLQTGGKRFVSVSSLGPDGLADTVDDVASSGSMEASKR